MHQHRGIRRGLKAARSGFTLIEVMIVIAIIVALSGLIGVAVLGRQKEAKVGLAQTDVNNLKSALKQFYLTYDRFPKDEEGIEVLWNKEKLDADSDATKWKKFLEDPMPNDRWGHAWEYRQQSEHGDPDNFDLWSLGPDGQDSTGDEIVSWTKTADETGAATDTTGTSTGKGN